MHLLRGLCLTLAICVVAAVFSGCGNTEQVEEPATVPPPATSPGGESGGGNQTPTSPGELPPPPR